MLTDSVADNWVAEKLPQSGRLEPKSPKITLFAFFLPIRLLIEVSAVVLHLLHSCQTLWHV
jgi:hypothetical protein